MGTCDERRAAGSSAGGEPIADQVRFVLVGHVDHGKSTLIGRLFHDTGRLPEGKYDQLVSASARRGVPFEWANLMDALQAERDQNVTIETAQIWFRGDDRRYVIIDAPGHKEFLKNLVTGAALADAGLVVIDVQEGVRDESRRHGLLLKLLGVEQVAVVVNKMDLVGYSARSFAAVASDYRAFLESIDLVPLAVVPASAKEGENVATRSSRMPWFDGESVLEALRRFAPRPRPVDRPLRLPVQDVYRFDHRRVVVGRIESGALQVGDTLVLMPGRTRSRVQSIERWNHQGEARAVAGESIGLTLAEQLFVERGAVAAPEDSLPTVTTAFRARVFWLGRQPLVPGRPYRIKLATQEADCTVETIERVIDGSSLADVERPVPHIGRDELGDVTIRARRPLVIDTYDEIPRMGRFVLVDGYDVAGGGTIVGALEATGPEAGDSRALVRSVGHVTRDERERRHRHRGAVVWLTGLSGSGKSTLASAIERSLFDRGLQAFVLDGDNVRLGLNRDLGFAMADRAENIRRVAEVAKLFAEGGTIAITAFISPYRSDRLRARQIMKEGGQPVPFLEVFLDAPLEVCEQRDPKGLYAKARAGLIKQFTGVSDPYEAPEHPELTLETGRTSVEACLAHLLERLLPEIDLEHRATRDR